MSFIDIRFHFDEHGYFAGMERLRHSHIEEVAGICESLAQTDEWFGSVPLALLDLFENGGIKLREDLA